MSDENIEYEKLLSEFDQTIAEKKDVINRIASFGYTITADDEWNDPYYDKYDKTEDK